MAAPQAGVEVLLVGSQGSSILNILADALERDGWPTARIADVRELGGRVSPRNKAVVVVRTSDAEVAVKALEALEPRRHSALVIVVVDRADLGEYYCLMEAGAVEYFEVSEDPLRILQGVEWAARVLAP